MISHNGHRDQVVGALRSIWASTDDVRRFQLSYLDGRIEHAYGAWTVPVATALRAGDAYETNRALERI